MNFLTSGPRNSREVHVLDLSEQRGVLRRDRATSYVQVPVAGLRALADSRYVSALIDLARDDDADVRYAAIGALGATRGPGAQDVLRAALEDPDRDLREAAGWALTDLGGA